MLYSPIKVHFDEAHNYGTDEINKNWEQLKKLDLEAKEKGELKGRYINQPYADGQAVYIIIKENKKTVRIKVCRGLGDDWVIPYWSEACSIDKNFAIQNINMRDSFSKLKAMH